MILVLTGVVKVIKNLPGVYLSPALITSMTLTHTFATIFFLLGVLAHLAALIFKVNRPLVKSVFTGEVNLGYVQDRHTVWYEELMKNKRERKVEAKVEVEDKVAEMEKEKVQAESEEKPEENDVAMVAAGIQGTQTGKEERPMSSTIKVKGMSCQHCVMSVTKALNRLEGIKNVRVDLEKGEVQLDNTKALSADQIGKAIEEAGYQVVST